MCKKKLFGGVYGLLGPSGVQQFVFLFIFCINVVESDDTIRVCQAKTQESYGVKIGTILFVLHM